MKNSNSEQDVNEEGPVKLRLELELDQANLVRVLQVLTESGVDFKLKGVQESPEKDDSYNTNWDWTFNPLTGGWVTIPSTDNVGVIPPSSTTSEVSDTRWSKDYIASEYKTDGSLFKLMTFQEDDLYGIGLKGSEAEDIAMRLRDLQDIRSNSCNIAEKELEDLILARSVRRLCSEKAG